VENQWVLKRPTNDLQSIRQPCGREPVADRQCGAAGEVAETIVKCAAEAAILSKRWRHLTCGGKNQNIYVSHRLSQGRHQAATFALGVDIIRPTNKRTGRQALACERAVFLRCRGQPVLVYRIALGA